MWRPNLDEIVVLTDKGSSNMGDVTDESSVARFSLDKHYVLVYARAHFSGSGTADCSTRIDSRFGPSHDLTLRTVEDVGGGADMFVRVEDDEYRKFTCFVGEEDKDIIVFEWTNPGTVYWGLEVGLAYAKG